MSQPEINKIIIDYLMPYDPSRIGLFGSRVRGDHRTDSDLDLLIEIKKRISLLDLVKMEFDLSDKLGVKVDLVMNEGIRNQLLRGYIEKDLKLIYEKR